MKTLIKKIYTSAVYRNESNIMAALEENPRAKVLDLGCGDGLLSLKLKNAIGCSEIYGGEIDQKAIAKAKQNGVKVSRINLNGLFSFKSSFFDVVIANQVIEHVEDTDNFLSEIYRVLRPHGYVIISTENGSSWINIFAAIMGWQIFSLTNFSSKGLGIGNPLAFFRGEKVKDLHMNHVRIYNYLGLKEQLELYGFNIEAKNGTGFFFSPKFMKNLDPIHSHFMLFKARKKKNV